MKLEQMKIKELLDTSHTIAEKLFEGHEYPWEVLGDINGFIESLGASLPENEYKKIGKNIWIHKTAQMAPTTAMGGPMIIGPKVQIRNGAFLRGSVILGQHVVIGNSCEIKNSIIFDEAQVPHFNYVGDSILGYKAHMGAGAVTSNVKADKGLVKINHRKICLPPLRPRFFPERSNGRIRHINTHHIAGFQLFTSRCLFSVQFNILFTEHLIEKAFRSLIQIFCQQFVQPLFFFPV